MLSWKVSSDERRRIIEVYRRREARRGSRSEFFAYESLAHLWRVNERCVETLRMLSRCGITTLDGLRMLDVGCGDGYMLRQYLQWGATPSHVAGIDIREDAVGFVKMGLPGIDVRYGDATELPWPDATFDVVSQHTVFTSILDNRVRLRVATEMKRVVKPGGMIVWYDFIYNNPRNADVRGIRRLEIESLFAGLEIYLKRVTLAPPIARGLPEGLLAACYPLLSQVWFIRTHYLGLMRKPRATEAC